MSTIAEAILASFKPTAQITWDYSNRREVIAHFTAQDVHVCTAFTQISADEWCAAFKVSPNFKNATEMVIASIEIYCGVFQCLREFLANRAGLLHVDPKDSSLTDLWKTYQAHPELVRE
jgi:hypothetical protein